MRVLAIALFATAVGCAHARPAPSDPAADLTAADAEMDRSDGDDGVVAAPGPDGVGEVWQGGPAVIDRKLEMLRQLVAASRGTEQLAARARLFEQLDTSPDPAHRAEALTIAAALVAEPGFAALAQADAVLYGHGVALQRARDDAKARAAWQRLVEVYPRSRWVPSAIVALADLAFNDGDLAAATALYPRAFADPMVGAYARYKRGWCAFNLGDGEQALADFLDVARAGRDPLRAEALKDAVRVYAQVGDAAKAAPFFRAIDRDHLGEHLLRLGETYLDVGKLREARRALADAQPLLDAAGACRAEAAIARAAWIAADRAGAAASLAALAGRNPDPACADAAAALASEVARALTVEARRLAGDRAAALAAWAVARTLASAGPRRADTAQALAEVASEHATAVGTAAAWAAAAEAEYEAAAAGVAGAVDAALGAWGRAVALDPGLASRAAAGRALLERLP
ncbi:MAG: hypothetical protein IPH44_40480 [Myxococcales bacterium]|nr:hypothetical protein [Myxococcales bacterium]